LSLQKKDSRGAQQAGAFLCMPNESNLAQSYNDKNYPKSREYLPSGLYKNFEDQNAGRGYRKPCNLLMSPVFAALGWPDRQPLHFRICWPLNKNPHRGKRSASFRGTWITRYQTRKKILPAIAQQRLEIRKSSNYFSFSVSLGLGSHLLGIGRYLLVFQQKLHKTSRLKQQAEIEDSFWSKSKRKTTPRTNDCWSQETCMKHRCTTHFYHIGYRTWRR